MNAATTIPELMRTLGLQARCAAVGMARATAAQKAHALRVLARLLREHTGALQTDNAKDLSRALAAGLAEPMVDRLKLSPKTLETCAVGCEQLAAMPDIIGSISGMSQQPSGIRVGQMRVPIGVFGMIYESRPNVTIEAASLAIKSGNACILRGGSEAIDSNKALAALVQQALAEAGLPIDAVQLVPTTDRAAVGAMLGMTDFIDVIVPRGGKSLVARVQADARVPVLAHLDGNCHVYVDAEAELEMARSVVLNAKLRRTGVCGAAETLLVDRTVAHSHLAPLVKALLDAGCAVRGDAAAQAVDARVSPATPDDWSTEYLDAVIAVGLVDGVDGAMQHINRHGSHHTDAIITGNAATAERFLAGVDSAIVLVNASTQFADGGEFGFGAEIGIATGRLHARGPVGPEQLTTFKYVVRGAGQTRP